MQHSQRTYRTDPIALRAVRTSLCTVFILFASVLPARAQLLSPLDRSLGVPDSGIVEQVLFDGNKSFPDEVIQSVATTRVPSLFERIGHTITFGAIGAGTQYTDQATRDRDTTSIEEFYKENGFLFAHASVEVRTNQEMLRQVEVLDRQNRLLPGKNRKPLPALPDTVIFHISEGPPSNVTGVSYSGLENLPTEIQPELTEHSLMKLNQRYASSAVLKETSRLQSILAENGYPFFKYDSVVVEKANDRSVNVHVLFFFETGHRYRFGNPHIVYDSTSDEKRQVHEVDILSQLDMQRGEWYKASIVQQSQYNLYRLDNFEIARIDLDSNQINAIPDSARDGQIIDETVFLRMKVSREILPGFFIGGGRFGQTGPFTFSAGVSLAYTDHNAFGGAENLVFQSSYLLLPKNEGNRSVNLDLTFPYRRIPILSSLIPIITNSPLTVGAGYSQAWQTGRSKEDLAHVHTGINATIGDPASRTSIVPDLSVEYDDRHFDDAVLIKLYNSVDRRQLNTFFAVNGQWDRTNDYFNPTKGFYTGGTFELGSPIIKYLFLKTDTSFGSAAYLKGVIHLKDFIELQENGRLVLGGRLRVGDIYLFHADVPVPPLTDVPFERRFYTGGGSSVRGWPSSSLLVAPRGDPNRLTSEGGYRLLEFNVELRWAPYLMETPITSRQKLLDPLRVGLFFDAGQVWDYGVTPQANQIALSIGTGIRYLTIFGAFRFDVGLKLFDPNPLWGTPDASSATGFYDKPAYPDTQGEWLFSRKFGWDVLQFQFNLGEAF